MNYNNGNCRKNNINECKDSKTNIFIIKSIFKINY